MNDFFDQYFSASFMNSLQNFIVALLVLLIGWLIAKMIGNAVEKVLKKTDMCNKLFSKFGSGKPKKDVKPEKLIGKIVYYILLVVVFIMFFNILNLNLIANPLSNLISTILGIIPALLKAALILVLAWVLATIAKWLIVEGTKKTKATTLFYKLKVAQTEEEVQSYLKTVGQIVFYLILLLFIPAVLNALNISGLAEPFSGLLATVLAFIPKLLAAVLIFAVGWFVAKIVKSIVENLLKAVGSEKLVSKLNLQKMFEGTSFAAFVGNLVFIIILIPITVSALEKLEIVGITDPAIAMLNDIAAMIPSILIAIGLVLLGFWLGKLVGDFIANYLARVGFNNLASKMNVGNKEVSTGKFTPAALVGYIVQVLIVFFLVIQALHIVQLDFLVGIASAITAYLPMVLSAVLILAVALILGNIVQKVLVSILSGPAANTLAGFAKYAILTIAIFMALTQLGIAPSIVNAAFILILGGLALAFGLAFGLGGKDFASKYLRKFDNTIDETKVDTSKAETVEEEIEPEVNPYTTDDPTDFR